MSSQKILITGAGGFVGQELAAALLASSPSIHLTLTDIAAPAIPAINGKQDPSRVHSTAADLTSPTACSSIINAQNPFDVIYLLHGIMSSGSEANLDLGLRVNLDSTRLILDLVRTTRPPNTIVIFTSSLAVYGPLPPGHVIDGDNMITAPQPGSSYGAQKLITEILLNDYTRRGLLDGRVVRLPTVVVRPGQPTAAASSFASGIVREPLRGVKSVCPVRKGLEMWVCSPGTVVKNLVHAKSVPKEKFGRAGSSSRVVNLPGLTVTVQEILNALEKVGGKEKRALVEEKSDPEIEVVVESWPARFETGLAKELGFVEDVTLSETVRQYVENYGEKA